MKNCVIIVDNSNVWIESTKYSAKQKGVLANVGEKDPCDPSWRIDFGQLINTVAGGLLVSKAILVGSRPPKNDSVWNAAKFFVPSTSVDTYKSADGWKDYAGKI